MRLPRRPRLFLVCLASAALVAGCGGGGSDGDADADPAAYLPADVSVYLETVVRPQGEQREELTELASKILRTDDPGARIRELLDDELSGDGSTTYEEDIEPWLGRRAGMYLTGLEADEPRFVVAIATRDADAAREAVDKAPDITRRGEHDGVEYAVNDEGEAAGVVDDALLVASSSAELERAIDAARGESLAESERFKAELGELPDDRVGTLFLDMRRFYDAAVASSQLGGAEASIARSLLGGSLQPLAAALLADGDEVAIEASTKVSGSLAALGVTGSTPLLGEAPADAWLAAGAPDMGARLKEVVDQVAGAVGGAVLQGQIEQQTGLDIEQDVFGWIGDIALFAQGDSPETLGGGVVIEVTDRERARRAIPKIVGAIAQQTGVTLAPARIAGADLAFATPAGVAPVPIIAALAGDRAVIAAGEDAAQAGLDPGSELSGEERFETAEDLTDGLEPSLVVDGPQALAVAGALAEGDPGFAQARPYLELIGVVAAGAGEDGDRVRQRLAVRLTER